MLTASQLATIRAALTFWEEEMAPHGVDAMRPYVDLPGVEPVPADELRSLRERFARDSVRYAVCDRTLQQLAGMELFTSSDDARQQAGPDDLVVTVLLPSDDA